METLCQKIHFFPLKSFIDKTTLHFHSFNKIDEFVTTQCAIAIFYPF